MTRVSPDVGYFQLFSTWHQQKESSHWDRTTNFSLAMSEKFLVIYKPASQKSWRSIKKYSLKCIIWQIDKDEKRDKIQSLKIQTFSFPQIFWHKINDLITENMQMAKIDPQIYMVRNIILWIICPGKDDQRDKEYWNLTDTDLWRHGKRSLREEREYWEKTEWHLWSGDEKFCLNIFTFSFLLFTRCIFADKSGFGGGVMDKI